MCVRTYSRNQLTSFFFECGNQLLNENSKTYGLNALLVLVF